MPLWVVRPVWALDYDSARTQPSPSPLPLPPHPASWVPARERAFASPWARARATGASASWPPPPLLIVPTAPSTPAVTTVAFDGATPAEFFPFPRDRPAEGRS